MADAVSAGSVAPRRTALITAAKITISATLTGVLFWRLAGFSALPSGSDWTAFVLAFLVQLFLPVLQVQRWRLACAEAGIQAI